MVDTVGTVIEILGTYRGTDTHPGPDSAVQFSARYFFPHAIYVAADTLFVLCCTVISPSE
jgi:hypothetical protein